MYQFIKNNGKIIQRNYYIFFLYCLARKVRALNMVQTTQILNSLALNTNDLKLPKTEKPYKLASCERHPEDTQIKVPVAWLTRVQCLLAAVKW
jgi:hypothetical protein